MSSNPISHVFFGVGGVLLTPLTDPAQAVETVLFARRRVRSPNAVRDALARAHPGAAADLHWTSGDLETARRLFENLGFGEEAASLAEYLCRDGAAHRAWSLAPGAVAALELLRREEIPAGVISSIGETLESTLEAVGLLPYLVRVLAVEESPTERRDAERLRATLAELEIEPESSWFLGTASEPAMARAARAGLRVLPIVPDPGPAGAPAEQASRVDEAVYRLLDGRG